MSSLLSAIVPKSDQLNADDLIGGPRTITITSVTVSPGEQPVGIHFEGDGGKPYRPCKSMCRVLVQLWGPDGKQYAGKSLTLYRDPNVKFGGMAVGGIRISHMSHLDQAVTLALTATRGKRAAFVVKPLEALPSPTKSETPEPAKKKPVDSAGMLKKFAALDVTRDMIEARIGHSVDQMTDDDATDLRSIYDRLSKRSAAKEEFFPEGSEPPLGDAAE